MNLISLRGSIVVGLGIGLLYLGWVSPALPHTTATGMKFDVWCCSGNAVTGDCQEIPPEAVKIDAVRGIVHVSLKPGDHPLVTKPHTYQMQYSKTRRSTDGLHYACLYPDETILRCLYLPPESF